MKIENNLFIPWHKRSGATVPTFTDFSCGFISLSSLNSMTWSHLKYRSEPEMTQQYHLPWLVFRFGYVHLKITSLLGHLVVRSVLCCLSQQLLGNCHWWYSRFELCCSPSAHYMYMSEMPYLPNAGPQKVFVTVMAAFIRFIFRSCLRHFCCMVFSFFLRILTCPSRCLIRFCWAQSLSTSQSLFDSSAV